MTAAIDGRGVCGQVSSPYGDVGVGLVGPRPIMALGTLVEPLAPAVHAIDYSATLAVLDVFVIARTTVFVIVTQSSLLKSWLASSKPRRTSELIFP